MEKDLNQITQQDTAGQATTTTVTWEAKWWGDRRAIETERVNLLRERGAKENVPLTYEQDHDPKSGQTNVRPQLDIGQSTIKDDALLSQATLCAAFGSANSAYLAMASNQVINAQFSGQCKDAASLATATVGALVSMNPQDIIEGQLCSRLLVLANQYNEYMRRAALPDQSTDGAERNINRATKLMRLYNETLDTLSKYRRKGEQRVVVQHVNVNNGGQAVVAGHLDRGEGSATKSEGVPHAN